MREPVQLDADTTLGVAGEDQVLVLNIETRGYRLEATVQIVVGHQLDDAAAGWAPKHVRETCAMHAADGTRAREELDLLRERQGLRIYRCPTPRR